MDKPSRRVLRFRDLDEVVRDAESLQANGYERVGNWDLAQACSHLEDWMRFPLEGYPRPSALFRVMFWVVRHTAGRRMLKKVLNTGTFPSGGPTLPETVASSGGDEAAAVERLRRTAARFRDHTGPLQPSPIFGILDHATATQLQLVHCAHHLSFLIPRTS